MCSSFKYSLRDVELVLQIQKHQVLSPPIESYYEIFFDGICDSIRVKHIRSVCATWNAVQYTYIDNMMHTDTHTHTHTHTNIFIPSCSISLFSYFTVSLVSV